MDVVFEQEPICGHGHFLSVNLYVVMDIFECPPICTDSNLIMSFVDPWLMRPFGLHAYFVLEHLTSGSYRTLQQHLLQQKLVDQIALLETIDQHALGLSLIHI